jgi:phosphopantetheinyl transferase (holo-ACP synthase)
MSGIDPRLIEIETPCDDRGRAMRPVVRVFGAVQPWSVSISHVEGAVMAAACLDPRVSVGVDVAWEERFSPGFLETWFTERERRQLEDAGEREIAIRWAIKEALYKACQRGEGFAPRRIEVLSKERTYGSLRLGTGDTEELLGQLVCKYDGLNLTDDPSVDLDVRVGRRECQCKGRDAAAVACLVALRSPNQQPVFSNC